MANAPTIPLARIDTEAELSDELSRPSAVLVEEIKRYQSPLLVLGAGGKMGPTLCAMARRAAELARHPLEVIAVSRFSDGASAQWLEQRGVATLKADLLDGGAARALPDCANVLYLVGLKFGTADNPSLTWAMNTIVPARVCERYARSRIVALSTGNVYPLTPVQAGGAKEENALTPLGEYPNAAVARERVFEFFSRRDGTPMTLLRLFYAVELRYGVLVDIAQKVNAGDPIPLANGYFNCIWQRDANDMALRTLASASSPPAVFNLCQTAIFSVRDVATQLGKLLGREPKFLGAESGTALLGNAAKIAGRLGEPPTGVDAMLPAIAKWVGGGGRNLKRPTHFEVRDGTY